MDKRTDLQTVAAIERPVMMTIPAGASALQDAGVHSMLCYGYFFGLNSAGRLIKIYTYITLAQQ